MTVTVTLSANAGVALNIGGRRVWVDALHEKRNPPFSTLSPRLQQQMLSSEAFRNPEFICYTHCHDDHYSPRLTQAAQKLWPNARVMIPEDGWGREVRVESKGLLLRFVRLTHEGEQYAQVPHYGIVLSCNCKNIFLSGDCALASDELIQALQGTPIHLMFLDFPWLTHPKGKVFLRSHFPDVPKIAYHLPFAEDDLFGYRKAAGRTDATLLQDPLQTITMEI